MTTADLPHSSVAALIFAGGSGTRAIDKNAPYADVPKQFFEIEGMPILAYTLQLFQQSPVIDSIYLVSNPSFCDYSAEIGSRYGVTKLVTVVPGGDSALNSIFLGLQRMVDNGVPDDAVVLVHDGVRPIITQDLIRKNIETAVTKGNAITCIPAYETVALRAAESDLVEDVIDRHRAVVLQAPQTFRLHDLYTTNVRAHADGVDGLFVDQAGMQRYYGAALHLVSGFRGNVKITVPEDVRYFTYMVQTGEYKRITASEEAEK